MLFILRLLLVEGFEEKRSTRRGCQKRIGASPTLVCLACLIAFSVFSVTIKHHNASANLRETKRWSIYGDDSWPMLGI
jgi:hypothetical protein